MIKPRTADDVRRNIRIYQDEAERSRKMAADRRQEADAEIRRAGAWPRDRRTAGDALRSDGTAGTQEPLSSRRTDPMTQLNIPNLDKLIADTARRIIQRIEDADHYFLCDADFEEAVEIAREEITRLLAPVMEDVR